MRSELTILYVEDDPNDAVVFERALKKSGLPISLQIAPDGKFAVEYLTGTEQYVDRERYPLPQIILSDMKMFRMGGIELLEWVRGNAKFREIPFVLYSTSNEDIDVSHAATAGATAYFRKTYQCLDVIEYLRNWLAEKSASKSAPASAAKKTIKPATVRQRPRASQ